MFIDIYDLYFQHMLLTPYLTNMYYCQYVNILDFVAHFPDDCGDIGPSCPTVSGYRATGGKCFTPSGEDMETRLRNLADEFMDAATSDAFLMKHLLSNLDVV